MRDAYRFDGHIAGVGTTSGVRLVVGHWHTTPYGAFADVMVETASGHRLLLAPSQEVAAFVEGTYVFDEVRIEDVQVEVRGGRWQVATPSLSLGFEVGGRTPLGQLLRLVPRPVAASPRWAAVTDPVARVVLRGVRTRGRARADRREYYGATDAFAVTSARGTLEGADLGSLAPVDPPCRFGFSSTPRRPSVTRVVTTVAETLPSGRIWRS